MKKEVIYGIGGLVIGAVVAGAIGFAVNKSIVTTKSGTSMTDMVASLHGKTGDEFDAAFLAGMIEHHEGAIDMAKLVQQNAKHDEIKNMANEIIAAQSKEIDMMQTWQADWGYKTGPASHDSMSH
jgi:uncharacterized protein (DUF305 family)